MIVSETKEKGGRISILIDLRLVPETRAPKEHFKPLFGSGTSDPAKIRPLKNWTSWISPWVPPYGILPQDWTKLEDFGLKDEVGKCGS